MNYEEALEYLTNLTKFGFNFGLERIRCLLQELGNPHHGLWVVHIGGTNGKGSTLAMLKSILTQAGYRVGAFISPHLESYTERVTIGQQEIAPAEVANLIAELQPHLEKMVREGQEHPTEFEVSTALAFTYFARQQVDLVLLEVGLGGAIDSTNVVEQPLLSVITNVGMDHMDYLGNSVAEIARVKAGIIKHRRPVVTGAQHPEALAEIRAACARQESPLIQVGQDVTWQEEDLSPAGVTLTVRGIRGEYPCLQVPLLGRHQASNAALALAALEILIEEGFPVSLDQIRAGLAATCWPARLELLGGDPLVVVDAAHNVDGAQALAQALRDFFQYDALVLVLGMLADKEREKVVALLAPLARDVVITRPHSLRAGNWHELAEMARGHGVNVLLEEDTGLAVELALHLAHPGDLVVITGSFYMVAAARGYLRNKYR